MADFPMVRMFDRFGMTLTDREDAKKAFAAIATDFKGVMSMGSSFSDEVVVGLARRQGNKIRVANANAGIRACIERVIEGSGITVEF